MRQGRDGGMERSKEGHIDEREIGHLEGVGHRETERRGG